MKLFTTGQVARMCNVSPRTVSKWFDSKMLPGFRVPGTRDRRITSEALIEFIQKHGMPMPAGLLDPNFKQGNESASSVTPQG